MNYSFIYQIWVPTSPKNPEIMKMLGFGLSNNKIENILNQIEAK